MFLVFGGVVAQLARALPCHGRGREFEPRQPRKVLPRKEVISLPKKVVLKKGLKKVKVNESTISVILGGLVLVALGLLVFNYFRSVNRNRVVTEQPTGQITQTPQAGTTPQGLPTTYTVTSGDSLWKIAEKYYGSGYNWVDIAKENNLKNPSALAAGQELSIPATTVILPPKAEIASNAITGNNYTIVKGDSLWTVAVRAYGNGYKWVDIAKANNLVNPDVINAGNTLSIPR